jgi:hypothetical protein
MAERDWLRLPVVSAGAEYLVMGQLMRRNSFSIIFKKDLLESCRKKCLQNWSASVSFRRTLPASKQR